MQEETAHIDPFEVIASGEFAESDASQGDAPQSDQQRDQSNGYHPNGIGSISPDAPEQGLITPERMMKLRIKYAGTPDRFLQMATGENVWWKQRDIMRAVARFPRVAVAAANSTGKSFLASRLVLWFLSIYTHATVITTAPDNDRVEHIMWREIRYAWDLARQRGFVFGSEPLTKRWELSDKRFAIGLAPRDYEETVFQGFHNRNMLVIVDEASGVEESIHKGIDSVVRGANYHILRIGNPTSIHGRFYKSFKQNNWWTTNISAFDSPNVQDGTANFPGIVTANDIEDAISEYGVGSWDWRVFIEGRFPDKEEDALISIDAVNNAALRGVNAVQLKADVEVGADIARFGSDKIVFAAQQGFHAFHYEEHKHIRTTETARQLLDFCDRVHARTVRIDTNGVGAGVTDSIYEQKPDSLNLVEMIGSSKAENPLKYANAVTEWWDYTANLLEDGIASGPLYGDKNFIGDLVSRKAYRLKNALLQLESKPECKARIRHSPDHGDALIMANASNIPGTTKKHIKGAPLRKNRSFNNVQSVGRG